MKPYRGIVRITCTAKGACASKRYSIGADCLNCDEALVEILDLEGEATCTLRRRPPAMKADPKLKTKTEK